MTEFNYSISNIGWPAELDLQVYELMRKYGFSGLEIAPTRIFPERPYERIAEAAAWSEDLKREWGFCVPSMQSIWYGRRERLFGTEEERKALIEYTFRAVDFAASIGCGNLVFGCPRNRFFPEDGDPETAVSFFRTVGDYAASGGIVIGMEANPTIYNTNYINDTASALDLIEAVGSMGFRLNLDVGTMVENGEDLSVLRGREHLISHVHISEPGLKVIQRRQLHSELAAFLKDAGYDRFVSIEVGKQTDPAVLAEMMEYVRNVMG